MAPKDDSIHLAFCFDERMELPFLIVADSIKRRLKTRRKVVFHALHTNPLLYCETYLSRISSDVCEFRFYDVKNPLADINVTNGATSATYLRFLLPGLLNDIERVVYIDCDTIVLNDITALHDTKLDGRAIAAVIDFSIVGAHPLNDWTVGREAKFWSANEYVEQVVELNDWASYFNAGIVVMDLDEFRRRDLVKKCEEFLSRTNDERIFNDQDALNYVINGAFVQLDPRWNVQACRKPQDFASAKGPLAAAAKLWQTNPWILHYTGPGKPWIGHMPGTMWDRYYWREAALSPMIPELIEYYLAVCEREKLTNLFCPRDLLALGKPKLDEEAMLACASNFKDIPAVSSAMVSLVNGLDNWHGARLLVIPSEQFSQRGGTQYGDAVVFDLANFAGHLLYGPYFWYPPGLYEATFDFHVVNCAPRREGSLVIEVASDGDCYKAQQTINANDDIGEQARTLMFRLDGSETFVEFRLFASDHTNGRLWLRGVRLQSIPDFKQ